MAKKKKNLSEIKNQRMDSKKSVNPFEVHINRQKFNVLGRQMKADRGLPGVARAKALKKRKETLLQEYKVLHKSNKFLDRRIGEKNNAMTKEDRIIARFSAERMKAHKRKNIFNLADDEVLTHKGQSIAEIEKFDDPPSDDDESDIKGLDANFVEEANFGGGTLRESKNNRAAIIEQLIAESKKRKAERQLAKERTLQKTEELDAEWKELIPIVNMSKYDADVEKKDSYDIILNDLKFEPRGTPSNKLKSEAEIAEEEARKLRELEEERLRRMRGEETNQKPKVQHRSADDLDDGFEIEEEDFELAYDKDGNPIGLDKLEDEKEAVSKSESEGSDSEEEDEEGGDDDDNDDDDEDTSRKEGDELASTNEMETVDDDLIEQTDEHKEMSDAESDDLSDLKVSNDSEKKGETDSEDENEIDSQQKAGSNNSGKLTIPGKEMVLDGKLPKKENSDISNENNDKVNPEINKKKKEIDKIDMNNEKSNTNDESNKHSEQIKKEKKKVSFNQEVKLVTFGSQLNISNKTAEEIEKEKVERKAQMDRARKELPYAFEAPSTYEELHDLLKDRSVEHQAVIIERIIKCNHPSLNEKNKEKMENLFALLMQHLNDADYPGSWSVLDRIAPFLFDLTQFSPSNSAYCLNEVILEKHSDYIKKKHKYPSPETFLFLKLVPLLFPTSDKRHSVTTPAFVFISEMLHQCSVTTRRAIASGLFLVSLLTEYIWLSKRFMPEALNFLSGVIHMASPATNLQVVPPFKKEHKFLFLHTSQADRTELNLSMRGSDLATKAPKIDDEFRVRAVCSALSLLCSLSHSYEEIPASRLIFEPIKQHLEALEINKYPQAVRESFNQLTDTLTSLFKKELNPIVMEAKKPKALRLYEPSIKPVYDTKKKDLPADKAEHSKLLYKYKKEMKGALREIRRDREFISKLKFKEQASSDAERKRKVKEIYSWGAQQQSEFKKLKRKKN